MFHDTLRTGIRDIGLTSLCTNLSICHSRIFRLTFIIYKMVSVLKYLSLPLFIPCNTSRSFPTTHIVTTLSLAHQLITKDKWTHFLRNRCINCSLTEHPRTVTFIWLLSGASLTPKPEPRQCCSNNTRKEDYLAQKCGPLVSRSFLLTARSLIPLSHVSNNRKHATFLSHLFQILWPTLCSDTVSVCNFYQSLRDSRLPPRSRWQRRSSGLLRSK
jgi:hypothetical protein